MIVLYEGSGAVEFVTFDIMTRTDSPEEDISVTVVPVLGTFISYGVPVMRV